MSALGERLPIELVAYRWQFAEGLYVCGHSGFEQRRIRREIDEFTALAVEFARVRPLVGRSNFRRDQQLYSAASSLQFWTSRRARQAAGRSAAASFGRTPRASVDRTSVRYSTGLTPVRRHDPRMV